jgi:hypothetical protein
MQIKIDASALKLARWHEYAVRFGSGGLITAVAGVIAKKYGPVVGGLFLAFPAIFPASATLIEKHERERKEKRGMKGVERGRVAVGADAAGAAMGSVGLFFFALLVWKFIPHYEPRLVLAIATLSWLTVSVLIWHVRKRV